MNIQETAVLSAMKSYGSPTSAYLGRMADVRKQAKSQAPKKPKKKSK